MKKSVLTIWIAVFSASMLIAVFIGDLYSYAKKPAAREAKPVLTTINPGQSFGAVIAELDEKGVIEKPDKFKLYARIKKQDRDLKAGSYMLSAAMSPEKILETLVKGKTFRFRVTIPEGYTLDQIASVLDNAGLVEKTEFLAAANDKSLAEQLGIEADNFEGYLFPDTYFFTKGIASEKIVKSMVARFRNVFDSLWENRPPDFAYTLHETVTLASIIEKETGAANERPLVASVFHNRLKMDMRLESDPTVIYGIEGFSGNLTRLHLDTPAPYNTYQMKGLPPGPIASPGKEALQAALYPAESEYIFFVSKNDSTHHFSVNYEEHRKAVEKYQLNR